MSDVDRMTEAELAEYYYHHRDDLTGDVIGDFSHLVAYSRGVADGRKAGRKEAAEKIRVWSRNYTHDPVYEGLILGAADIAEGEDDE